MADFQDKENSLLRDFDKQCVLQPSCKRNRLDSVAKMMEMDVNQSPMFSPQWLSSVKLQNSSPMHDSPFSLFKTRKRRSRTAPSETEAMFPSKEFRTAVTTTPTRSAFAEVNSRKISSCGSRNRMEIDMNFSSPGTLNQVIQKSMQNPNLIGDFSKPCLLPTIRGKHEDLPSVSPETVVQILKGQYQGNYRIIDCRYPYEYDGGHVIGAKNLYTKEAIVEELLPVDGNLKDFCGDTVIFYCEFSSQRAPKMYRFLRGKDRELNADSYPSLLYPEMYLLEGGYKSFYANFKEYCDPQGYKTMLDKNNTEDMVHFRAKCKSDTTEYRRTRSKARSGLKF